MEAKTHAYDLGLPFGIAALDANLATYLDRTKNSTRRIRGLEARDILGNVIATSGVYIRNNGCVSATIPLTPEIDNKILAFNWIDRDGKYHSTNIGLPSSHSNPNYEDRIKEVQLATFKFPFDSGKENKASNTSMSPTDFSMQIGWENGSSSRPWEGMYIRGAFTRLGIELPIRSTMIPRLQGIVVLPTPLYAGAGLSLDFEYGNGLYIPGLGVFNAIGLAGMKLGNPVYVGFEGSVNTRSGASLASAYGIQF